jgi:DinB superfamily
MVTTRWPGALRVFQRKNLPIIRFLESGALPKLSIISPDSETISGIRLRTLIVEDHPLIQGYDQEVFAVRLNYNQREIAPALDAFRSTRANTAQVFDSMSEEDWQREGTHSESGSYRVEDWLRIYSDHAHNHAAQIRRLREALAQDSRT